MKILISGLINIETSLSVDHFPIEYNPIEYPYFGIESCVSGVGYNVSKALKTLGSDVTLLSVIGKDTNGDIIKQRLKEDNIDNQLLNNIEKTPQSVVLVDNNGKRKIYCDLKDIQDVDPLNDISLNDYSLLVLTNINFNRELLKQGHDKGIDIATDVHVISDINDSYNSDFMKYADILFFSNEAIIGREEEFMKEVYQRYRNKIIVCGCGNQGAKMYLGNEDKFYYEKAVAPKGIISTVGAGDALFSSFLYFYKKGEIYQKCLRNAAYFAGLKIACPGGSNGFVNEEDILKYIDE